MATMVVVGSDEERVMEIPDQYVHLLPGADLVLSQTEVNGDVTEETVKITKIEIPATLDVPNKIGTTGSPRLYVGSSLKKLVAGKAVADRDKVQPLGKK